MSEILETHRTHIIEIGSGAQEHRAERYRSMKRFTHTRRVKADHDEWIVVDRPRDSETELMALMFLFLIVPFLLYIAIQVLAYVTGVVMLILLLIGLVWAIGWVNLRAKNVLQRDIQQKRWCRICIAAAGWLTISGSVFTFLRPMIIELFTTRRVVDTGLLWWKRSTPIVEIDGGMVWLTFSLYWLCCSLPVYAAVSTFAAYLVRKHSRSRRRSEP